MTLATVGFFPPVLEQNTWTDLRRFPLRRSLIESYGPRCMRKSRTARTRSNRSSPSGGRSSSGCRSHQR